jgi:hypothetical protein
MRPENAASRPPEARISKEELISSDPAQHHFETSRPRRSGDKPGVETIDRGLVLSSNEAVKKGGEFIGQVIDDLMLDTDMPGSVGSSFSLI